jgi:PAS domain S-box-containing protein
VIENSAVATFVLDTGHKVLIWNKACEQLTGVPASRVIGTDSQWSAFYQEKRPTLADIIIDGDGQDLSLLYQSHSRSQLTDTGLQAEGWYPNLNGKDRYIIFDANPIYDSTGGLVVVIETLQDITERKRSRSS